LWLSIKCDETQECRRRNIVRGINRGDNPQYYMNFEELNAQSCMDFEELVWNEKRPPCGSLNIFLYGANIF